MTPGESVDGPNLPQDLVLEDALQIVSAAAGNRANVVDAEGEIVGSIDLDRIIGGIARPDESSQGEKYR